MCEANVYLLLQGEEELIMKSVDIVKPERERVYSGHIWSTTLGEGAHQRDHRIVLEKD